MFRKVDPPGIFLLNKLATGNHDERKVRPWGLSRDPICQLGEIDAKRLFRNHSSAGTFVELADQFTHIPNT